MMLSLWFSLLLLCSSLAYADVENVSTLDESTAPVVNENFRTLNNNVNAARETARTVEGYYTNGVLNTNHGGTGRYTYADGQVLIGSTTQDTLIPATLTAGTGISVTNGSGSISIANTVSSYLVLTSTTSMSGVSTSADVTIDKTKMYLVKVIITSESNSAITQLRFNGVSTSTYSYINRGFAPDTTASNSNSTSAGQINIGTADAASTAGNRYIEFTIFPQGTTGSKNVAITGREVFAAGSALYHDFTGWWVGSADVTKFNLLRSVGDMTGTIYLYELKIS